MQLRHLLALPLIGALAQPAQAADRPKLELQLDDYSLQTRDFCFASGLRVSFQEDHSQPMVSVTSVIDRGADADPAAARASTSACRTPAVARRTAACSGSPPARYRRSA